MVLVCSPLQAKEASYNDSNPAISPDGKYVAFYSDRSGNTDEYLLNLETGEVRQLTMSPLGEYGPGWSPDSYFIYFYRGRDGRFEVFKISVEEGAEAEQVTSLGGYVGNPDISPDGREMLVAWNEGVAGNDYEIFVIDLETGGLTQLTDNKSNEYTPTWSPDGSRIAFNSNREGQQFDIYVMDSSGRNQQKIADLNPHDYYTTWTPDGQWVAFFSGPDFENFDAYKVNVETGEIVQITNGMGAGKVSFSKDGAFMVYDANHPEGTRLYWGKPDGSGVRVLEK